MHRVRAFAPATVANLGVGFDILGLAVDGLGDFVTVEMSSHPGVEVVEITGDEGKLPRTPEKNTAAIAAQSVLKHLRASTGIRLWLNKGLPLASGLGSSAASAVAAAVATNVLFGETMTREDLLPAVLDAEEAVSGRHADNVAPALLGGIVLITGHTPAEIHRLPIPEGLYLSLVTPDVEVPTAKARAVLPEVIPLKALVHQTGVVAELIHALHVGNIHLLARSMQRDTVVEPARASLIPFLKEAKEVAYRSGALATVISGSGPTLCSLCLTSTDAEAVNLAIAAFYKDENIGAMAHAATPSATGASIVEAL
ncbi:MAG: homoserine kinase [Anaerolineae bacterium]|nr:homoserine kinase [Anaerolineae bacterium]